MVLSKLSAVLALAAVPLASASSHFIMGGLKPIAYERLDPIVNQGAVSDIEIFGFQARSDTEPWPMTGQRARSCVHGSQQPECELKLRFPSYRRVHVRAFPGR